MSNRKRYNEKCFSPNWIEIDLETVNRQQKEVIQVSDSDTNLVQTEQRKDSLENKQRKDLNTLLKELDDIKQNIERVAEKQQRLANLMKFYSDEFAF